LSVDATCEGVEAVSKLLGQACATDTAPTANAKARAAVRYRISYPPVLAITASVRAITHGRKSFCATRDFLTRSREPIGRAPA